MYEHLATEGKVCPLPGSTTFNCIIFPSASYLKGIDPDGTMNLDELSETTREDIDQFAEMMDNLILK